eukprot:scaffold209385_cov73-Attheya_sp.AAC.2
MGLFDGADVGLSFGLSVGSLVGGDVGDKVMGPFNGVEIETSISACLRTVFLGFQCNPTIY